MKKSKLKIMEWNIHGAGGYGNNDLPKLVPDTIISNNADIAVLVKFYCNSNWTYFIKSLEKKYDIFISPYVSGHNQVLIAVERKTISADEVISINVKDSNLPEFLHLNIHLRETETPISIIGVRMKQCVNRDKKNERKGIFEKLPQRP